MMYFPQLHPPQDLILFIDVDDDTVALTLDRLDQAMEEMLDNPADRAEFMMDLFEGGTWKELAYGERSREEIDQLRDYLRELRENRELHYEGTYWSHSFTNDEASLYVLPFVKRFVDLNDSWSATTSDKGTWILTRHGSPNIIDRLLGKPGPVVQQITIERDAVWFLSGTANEFHVIYGDEGGETVITFEDNSATVNG